MYTILRIEKKETACIDQIYKDDVVSRQSITRREGVALGLNDDAIYVLIEGSEEGVKRAEDICRDRVKILVDKEKEEMYKKFRDLEENSLEGMGSIFG